MVKNIIGTFTIFIVLSACAPMVQEVKVAYSPIGEPARMETKSAKKIRVEPFIDKRVSDALAEITSQSGGSIGKFVAGTDVAKVITDAVKVELANQGYQITKERNEDIILSGALIVLTGQIREFLFTGRVEGGAQVIVALTDTRQGKIIWSDMVNGKSEVTYTIYPVILPNKHSKVEEAINLAIRDLVNKLVKSESFHEALR